MPGGNGGEEEETEESRERLEGDQALGEGRRGEDGGGTDSAAEQRYTLQAPVQNRLF